MVDLQASSFDPTIFEQSLERRSNVIGTKASEEGSRCAEARQSASHIGWGPAKTVIKWSVDERVAPRRSKAID
jgi:hypothetical protein